MTTVNPNHPIHPKFHERISAKVEGQLPAFVKEDHQLFVDFMEAYYEYMEQEGKPYEIIGSLDNYANVDKTVDDFLQYFKKQFGEDIPEAVFENANKPFVLKHLRDFYRTKGSEKSFQFLFRLLYKQEITFYFPREDILRVSDGKYSKDKIIRVLDNTVNDGVYEIITQENGNQFGHVWIEFTSKGYNSDEEIKIPVNLSFAMSGNKVNFEWGFYDTSKFPEPKVE